MEKKRKYNKKMKIYLVEYHQRCCRGIDLNRFNSNSFNYGVVHQWNRINRHISTLFPKRPVEKGVIYTY